MTGDEKPASSVERADKPRNEDGRMIIFFKDNSHRARGYRVKTQRPLGGCMRDYADSMHLDMTRLRFIFDGERVMDDTTPAELNMEPNDIVDVYAEAVSGGNQLDGEYEDVASNSSWSVVSDDDDCAFPDDDEVGSVDARSDTTVKPSNTTRPIQEPATQSLKKASKEIEDQAIGAISQAMGLLKISHSTRNDKEDGQRSEADRPDLSPPHNALYRGKHSAALHCSQASTSRDAQKALDRAERPQPPTPSSSSSQAAMAAQSTPTQQPPINVPSGPHGRAVQPPPSQHVWINFVQSGKTLSVLSVERNAMLRGAFYHIAMQLGRQPSELIFSCKGIRLLVNDTPRSFGMKDFDHVHVVEVDNMRGPRTAA